MTTGPAPPRAYDVVLYGAGGFTGRQTVAYFAKHAPPQIRWAIAGRHRAKLEAVRSEIGGAADAADILIADSSDQASVDALVARTRIVLSTAGPFALYGTPVVDACVRLGTHYVDITGETFWVRELVTRYHHRAAAAGIRIVPCCGFDSVPSDLGSLMIVRHVQQARGVTPIDVRSYFQLGGGGLNGGTIATLLNMVKTRPAGSGEWTAADFTPHFDAAIGTWVGPFFMAPTNSWMVRRSAALFDTWGEPYGGEFTYREFLKFDPPMARVKAVAATAALAAFGGAIRQPLTRRAVEPLLPKPGEGPTTKKMDEGWFTCDVLGLTADGGRARAFVRHPGDAGNRATVTFVCESALALAVEPLSLPGGDTRGGLLTPATAFGFVLVERLRRAGTTLTLRV